jgi:hypothetical protein
MNQSTASDNIPIGHAIALVTMALFIIGPPAVLVKEGSELFGENYVLKIILASVFGGAISGIFLARDSRFFGSVSGAVASLGASSLYFYGVFPSLEFFSLTFMLIIYFVGALPGIGLYFVVMRIIRGPQHAASADS